MKALMMIPAGLIGLMSFGHAKGPVRPPVNNDVMISDTTGPGHHHMKGNNTDSTGSKGNWKGKGKTKHNQSSTNSSNQSSDNGTTGTSSGGTGTKP